MTAHELCSIRFVEQFACTGSQTVLPCLAVLWAMEALQVLTVMAFAPEVHDSRTA